MEREKEREKEKKKEKVYRTNKQTDKPKREDSGDRRFRGETEANEDR
jgi:hypothetical protein